MVNSRYKGNRTKNSAKRYFEHLGYLVGNTEFVTKYSKESDLFGLFDLIGIHPLHGILLIQVKTNKPALRKSYLDFTRVYPCHCCCITWYNYRGWVLQYYKGGDLYLTEDLRKGQT